MTTASPDPPTAAPLAPFKSTLADAVDEALAAIFSAPVRGWEDRARHRGDDALAVLVRLEGGAEVELTAAGPGRRGYFEGQRVVLGHRSPPADRGHPRFEAFMAAVDRARDDVADADALGAPIEALAAALATLRAFAPVDDWMFRQGVFPRALLRLGFRCNQDCAFCWQGRDWPEPPAERFIEWLDAYAAEGRTFVSFSGGEPTLHPELPRLIERAREHGMTAWIQTNAIQLAKPHVLERLVDAGLQGCFVSYHAAEPALSDAMTRAPRTHQRTERGIAAALAAGLRVELNCVVERVNAAHLPAHAAAIVERFVTPFSDNPVRRVSYSHPCESYDPRHWEDAVVPLTVVQPPLIAALRTLLAAGVEVEGVGTCGFPPCLLRAAPDLLERGDVLRAMAPDAQSEGDVSGRVYTPACEHCALRSRCLGMRSEVLRLVGDAGIYPFRADELPASLAPASSG
jgi:pyruvate-formate lyase-activating enzyme